MMKYIEITNGKLNIFLDFDLIIRQKIHLDIPS